MKKTVLFLIACLTSTILFSQTYWSPVSAGTSGSMVLIGKIQINGVDQASDQLELGVFCGDECRGACIAHLFTYVQPNYYMVDPMVYGDAGNIYTFKLYDHGLNQELDVTAPESIPFTENGYGTVFSPYVLNFIETYTVTVTADPIAGGDVSGDGTYDEGQSCTVIATPSTGYDFINWTENGTQVSSNANYTFTVTANRNLVAHFQLQSFTITTDVNPTTGGSVSGSGTYNYGASCTLTATPATGYSFTNWTKDGVTVSTNANYTFTVTSAGNYVANFTVNTYQITATANPSAGGTITGTGTYNHGTSCTLTATANEGYTFVNWTKDGEVVSTNATYSFTVTEAADFVANFELNSYGITATAIPTAGGTITGAGTYNHFETCTLTATAAEGYTFLYWIHGGEQVSWNAVYSFTVTGPAQDTAYFELNSYGITATASPEAGGTITGAGTYNHFETCTLTATANEGYAFVNWTKNGNVISTNATYSFTVTETASFVANFELNSYGITATASPEAGGTITGAGTYNHFETCTLTTTANEGYAFVNWTKDGEIVSTNATYSFTVTESATYVAHFQIQSYTVTISANPTTGGTVSGGGTYTYGQSCTVHATANTGYTFVNWTENGTQVSTNADYTFTVTGNKNLVAHFSASSYIITAMANPVEGGIVSGSGGYNYGDQCTLTATANEGYTFVNWTKDGEEVSTNTTYSFTVTETASFVANFELNSYEITATASPTAGGTVTGAGTYNYGTSCTLTPTANEGYTFVNWTKDGNVVSTNATYSFTVTEVASFIANFELNSYEISVTASPTASGIVTGAGTYNHGTSCTLTATANEGYTFVNWTKAGEEVSTNATYSFTVTESATYVAHFQLQSYTVTISANPTTGGTVNGGGTYTYGQNCIVHAAANTGYTFVNWTENGTQVSTNVNYVFTVTGNRNLVAHFSTSSYIITATAYPAEGGTVTGSGGYNYGDHCTLTATANQGYTFVKWTKNGTQVSANAYYTFTVTESATYVAHFQAQSYTISVSADPTEGGIINGGGTYTYGQTCTLNVEPNENYIFINWTENGNEVSTDANYTFTVSSNRTLVAHLQYVDVISESSAIEVAVYPNPTNYILIVETNEPVDLFEIYSLTGALVYSQSDCDETIRIDVSQYAIGTYTVRLTTNDAVIVRKFVKTR